MLGLLRTVRAREFSQGGEGGERKQIARKRLQEHLSRCDPRLLSNDKTKKRRASVFETIRRYHTSVREAYNLRKASLQSIRTPEDGTVFCLPLQIVILRGAERSTQNPFLFTSNDGTTLLRRVGLVPLVLTRAICDVARCGHAEEGHIYAQGLFESDGVMNDLRAFGTSAEGFAQGGTGAIVVDEDPEVRETKR